MEEEEMRRKLEDAVQLSTEIIRFLKEDRREFNSRRLMFALAICYSSLAKGTNVPLHAALELVMTIYKHTEVIDDEV